MYIIYSNHFTPTPASHLWVYTTEVNDHHLSLNSSAAVSPEPFSVRDPVDGSFLCRSSPGSVAAVDSGR